MLGYDDHFFDTVDYSASKTAAGILCNLLGKVEIKSVLDLGCGRGAWLAWWAKHGATDVFGIDGSYVDVNKLHIPRTSYLAFDLTKALALERKFDLVQTLEVVEHLDPSAGEQFIDNLVRHGSLILFSAAIPGQGGLFHVNERPWQYWRELFAARGYEVFDFIRPLVKNESNIVFWYRQNTFIYAHQSIISALPAEIRASHVPAGQPLENYMRGWVIASTILIRMLPRSIVDRLAQLKWLVIMWAYRLMGGASKRQSANRPAG
jgi:SAM-dependent methyltransferase